MEFRCTTISVLQILTFILSAIKVTYGNPASKLCVYEDKMYSPGVIQLEPCVECECFSTGQLKCNAQVCPPLSPSCTRHETVPGECCPQCVEWGCHYNNATYAKGTKIPSDSCQRCYCPWTADKQAVCIKSKCPSISGCSDLVIPKGQCCHVCRTFSGKAK